MAHARRKFDEARKATPGDSSHAKSALDFIRELYLIEHTLWDREHPVTPARRLEVRSMRSAPIMTRFHAWLEALSSQVLPESRLGKAVHYTLEVAEADHLPLSRRSVHRQQPLRERHSPIRARSQGLALQ
jgi:transposase